MENESKSYSTEYEAVIFDMDGVIINSKDHVEKFWLQKLDKYGIEIPKDEREERFHGRPARPTVNDLFAELSKEKREKIIEECGEYDASVKKYPMIPGVEHFLKQCKEADILIGLVTSALPGKVDRMLAGLSFTNPFEVTVTANLVSQGKPDPECYLLAAKQLGVNPQKIVVFEDSVSGVKSASASGANVLAVNEDTLTEQLIEAGAKDVLPDFQKAKVVRSSGKAHIHPTGKGRLEFLVSTVG